MRRLVQSVRQRSFTIFKPWTFIAFAWSAADKFFKNVSWTHFSPLLTTILGMTILPWSFIGDILIFVERWVDKRDIRAAIFILCKCKLEVSIARLVLSFPAFILNQNVETLSTKLGSVDKSIPFPQHFFFSGKWICYVWKCCLASCRRVMSFHLRILLDFAKVTVHVLVGTLVNSCCRLFWPTLIRFRNLGEPRQDLQARDFQCLSDFSLSVARFNYVRS